MRTRISASTAPSVTISPSSSIRSTIGSSASESQRDLVLYLPDEILVVDHYSAKAWTDRYDYSGDGFSTEGLPRDSVAGAVPAIRPHPAARRSRARRICPPRREGQGKLQVRRPVRGGAGADVLRALRDAAIGNLPAAEGHQPVALFLLHQSRRGRIPDRRVAGNVRAGQWAACRNLPDLRHDQARRRRDFGLASRS